MKYRILKGKIKWNKQIIRDQNKMTACLLKNQLLIMEIMQKELDTFKHTARFGNDYINKLQDRIDCTSKYFE